MIYDDRLINFTVAIVEDITVFAKNNQQNLPNTIDRIINLLTITRDFLNTIDYTKLEDDYYSHYDEE